MNKFPLYNYKSINKLSQFLNFKEKKDFNKFLNDLKLDSKSFYKIYTLKSKKNRKVFECNPFLKKVHNKLKNCFTQLDTPDYLFSGVKKKSYIDNAKYHKDSKSFYIIDISKFYPSISKEKIYNNLISSFNQSHNVADAISNIITIQFDKKRFLVTGSPLSQIVAYFINKPMFNKIQKISKMYDIKFTVYVDDLTFSSKKNIPSKFKHEIHNIIKYYGYSCSLDKIQSMTLHEKTKNHPIITGVSIQCNSILDLPKKRKVNFFEYIDEFLTSTTSNIDIFFKNLDKVNGLITESIQINKDYYIKEKKKVNEFIKENLTINKEETKKYILGQYSILNEYIIVEDITIFAKKYLTAITKTTRLLNIIKNDLFSKEVRESINEKYEKFSVKNKSQLVLLSKQKNLHPLTNKIVLDYKRNKIYNI